MVHLSVFVRNKRNYSTWILSSLHVFINTITLHITFWNDENLIMLIWRSSNDCHGSGRLFRTENKCPVRWKISNRNVTPTLRQLSITNRIANDTRTRSLLLQISDISRSIALITFPPNNSLRIHLRCELILANTCDRSAVDQQERFLRFGQLGRSLLINHRCHYRNVHYLVMRYYQASRTRLTPKMSGLGGSSNKKVGGEREEKIGMHRRPRQNAQREKEREREREREVNT